MQFFQFYEGLVIVSTWCQDVHKYLYSGISKKYSLEKKAQPIDAQTAPRNQEFELVIPF